MMPLVTGLTVTLVRGTVPPPVDRELLDEIRALRREIAELRGTTALLQDEVARLRLASPVRRIVPFVDDMSWIGASGDVFTDAHPTYPGTVPLFQVWAALALATFDDALMNVSWPLFLAALAILGSGVKRLRRFIEFNTRR